MGGAGPSRGRRPHRCDRRGEGHRRGGRAGENDEARRVETAVGRPLRATRHSNLLRRNGSCRGTIVQRLIIALAVLAVMPAPTTAQTDTRAAAREIVRKWQDAIVTVRVTLKLRMSMGGREMNSSD